jgi:cysteine desulfurase
VDASAWGSICFRSPLTRCTGPRAGHLPAASLAARRAEDREALARTENTLAIAGFGTAARLAAGRALADAALVERLRDRLERGILDRIPGCRIVGATAPRLANTSAVLFEGASGEALLIRLDLEGVAVSVGSACSSGTLAPSPVLLSLGLSREQAKGVVRFSLSRMTREEEIDRVLELLPAAVAGARDAGGERADALEAAANRGGA